MKGLGWQQEGRDVGRLLSSWRGEGPGALQGQPLHARHVHPPAICRVLSTPPLT